ncbi:hypothetical protein Barb6_02242 [Bacteroidales bacterium Barb6]|nr:hypothetical protein Barb6_02242 [Bacteroidales bacterium Barb6]
MMKKVILISMAVLFSLAGIQTVQAQEALRNKQIYVEGGGAGVALSFNFDSRFKSGEALGFGYRAGLGLGAYSYYDGSGYQWYTNEETGEPYSYYSFGTERTRAYFTIPLGLNYIFGKKNSPHTFEVGAGATILTRKVDVLSYDGHYKEGYLIGHLSFMYRRVPVDGGFTWRIGVTPIIGTAGDIVPMLAVGIGYAF